MQMQQKQDPVLLRPQEDCGQRVVQLTSDMAGKLSAAKPLTWRGKGDLPQAVWATPPKGSFLLVELWSGISGLAIAMLSVGMTVYGAAAEVDVDARRCAQAVLPHLVHYDSVEQVHAEDFKGLLTRRRPRAVILGGGSPCQGNSALNASRRGLSDPRSLQPWHLHRLRQEFSELPEMADVELILLLENVASMQQPVREQYDQWIGCSPLLIEAGYFGWVHRKRLYWLASKEGRLGVDTPLPPEWAWIPPSSSSSPLELRFQGKKPFPSRVVWDCQFTPLFDPQKVMAQGGKGGFHTFTREFFHPDDRVHSCSAEAAARFYTDNRRFPPGAYESHSLLWRRDDWRQPSSAERCALMGIPPAAVMSVHTPPARREQQRNSLIGNGFHIPSIMILMTLLPHVLQAKFIHHPLDPGDGPLKARIAGTVWEPGRLEVWPHLLEADDVVALLPSLFSHAQIPAEVLSAVQLRLGACRLRRLQEFVVWQEMRGEPVTTLGPTPIFGRDRSWIYSGLTGQRYPSSSSRGLDHLLPAGLGMTDHVDQAKALPSPFAAKPWPEDDVGFVVEAIAVWQHFLVSRAAEQRHILKTLALALSPLENWLAGTRSASATLVAASKRPAFCAVMAILLRWPDLSLGSSLVRGFPIVGVLANSGVFRHVTPDVAPSLENWLGPAAEQAIHSILTSGPPRYHEDILAVTEEEQAKNFCSPFLTKKELDDRFGVGSWRPMERFLIVQSDGKKRVIDNARKSGHNSVTTLFETIHTVSVDFVASVAAMLATQVCQPSTPEWLSLRIGTDDLPDAYRGLPVCEEHLAYSVVAIYVAPVGWRFTILHGLAYGLESAVVAFNRFPLLGIAISRRCALALGAAYFDDQLAMEVVAHADVSQRGIQQVFRLMGAPPQPSKSFSPAANRHYLGTSVHTADFCFGGTIRFQPKTTTKEKVSLKLQEAISSRSLSRDDAGKLRGDLCWLFSMCAGHSGKVAGPLLTAKQHGSNPDLSPDEVHTLELLRSMVDLSVPRDVHVRACAPQPLLIYSDASFEGGILKLGWVIFDAHQIPVGRACTVPNTVLSSWLPRRQQISPGETLCGLLIPTVHPSLLERRDVLWFVDNECAVSSLIKASSPQRDIHLIAQFSQAAYHALQTRVWFEWIDSSSNPSDGLSRDGLGDEWTRQQDWNLAEVAFPPDLLPTAFWQSFLSVVLPRDHGC